MKPSRVIKKNHKVLQPIFGIPAHNNKLLQLLYPLLSSLLIAYAVYKLLQKEKMKKFIESLCEKLGCIPPEISPTSHAVFKIIFVNTSIIFGLLFCISLIRTISSKQNFEGKWQDTSKYSKINDFLYFSGAATVIIAAIIPFYALLSDTKLPYTKDNFSVDEITLYIATALLACALIMSLVSIVLPSLTEPNSFIEAATQDNTQKTLQQE